MRREWKPGDAFSGRIQQRDREMFFVVEVTGNSRAAWGDGLHAINADGNGYRVCDIADRRPLAVIDPEDREQVERLDKAIRKAFSGAKITEVVDNTSLMQAALREFANPTPPKPDEPTGLGAAVEATAYTSEVRTFVRIAAGEPDCAWWMDRGGNHHAWSELDDPRVLSEGVEVDR